MHHQPSTATRVSVVIIVTLLAIMVVWSAPPARAVIDGVSATISDPSPNPVPAGSSASLTADFSLAMDTGPITVSVRLQADPGAASLRLDAATTTSELTGCAVAVPPTSVSCSWDGDAADSPQILGVFVDVDSAAQPGSWLGLEAVVESPSDSSIYYWSGLSVSPPSGTTTLSGTVITTGGAPVGAACVFVISSPLFIWPAVTDSSGSWSVGGLPDDYTFIVGVVPPFSGTYGPCANDGPPPIPGPGDLQPVFVDSIWVDLANPALTGGQGDPYVFAVNAGARVLSTSESGVEACLSTAPSTQVPRPVCVASVVTTTSTTIAEELPLTGPDDNLALGAVALLGAGLALLGTVRRKTV